MAAKCLGTGKCTRDRDCLKVVMVPTFCGFGAPSFDRGSSQRLALSLSLSLVPSDLSVSAVCDLLSVCGWLVFAQFPQKFMKSFAFKSLGSAVAAAILFLSLSLFNSLFAS
jgi:hypothetical protein